MTLSDRDAQVIAEMRERLNAEPPDMEYVAALAARRHKAAVTAGVRCPKPTGCAICDADRRDSWLRAK